jgi:transcription initiation factor IIF auxiliary subunit
VAMVTHTPLNIVQSFHYEGDDWWKWSVWIEGPSADLDSIDSVTYILHPTFSKPMRVITDRAANFRLDSEGWGTFVIRADIAMKSGEKTTLSHELRLEYPDGSATLA